MGELRITCDDPRRLLEDAIALRLIDPALNDFVVIEEREMNTDRKLDDYQDQALATAYYPGRDTPLGLMAATLSLTGEVGELAGEVDKAYRNDGVIAVAGDTAALTGVLSMQRWERAVSELGDVLWWVAAVASELGVTMSHVAETNLAKLEARRDAGTLKSSGRARPRPPADVIYDESEM